MRNLSSRAAENLAEEIELLGPKRLSEVEEAQAKIVTRDPRARAVGQDRDRERERRCAHRVTSARAAGTDRPVASPVLDPLAGVRPARLDRPLTGAQSVGRGGAWGDPALDAALAEAIDDGRRQGSAQGYAVGWAAGMRAAADRGARGDSGPGRRRRRPQRRERLGRAESLLAALAEARREVAASAARPGSSSPTCSRTGPWPSPARLSPASWPPSTTTSCGGSAPPSQVLADDGRLVVHLHPDDVGRPVGGRLPGGTQLVPDAAVRPGTVDVQGDVRRLRLDVPAAVAAAEEVLRS